MQEHKNAHIIVRFDLKIRQHSAVCVRGLREVFDVNRRPWVNVDGASPDTIAAQVQACPSGALTFELVKKD